MVVTVEMKDGTCDKYGKVVCVGVLGSRPNELYIQTRARGNAKETFVALSSIRAYMVREPR